MAAYTVVEYLADHDGYRCGYCGSQDSNFSRGMWAHSMTCEDYQDLIDRGWRRSGKYVYKPTMTKMCCPSYTIRCEALKFKASKSQKKVLKMVTRYLANDERRGRGEKGNSEDVKDMESGEVTGGTQDSERQLANHEVQGLDSNSIDTSAIAKKKTAKTHRASQKDDEHAQGSSEAELNRSKPKKEPKPGLGPDPNKPPCKKAKQLRLERKQQKLAQRQETADAAQNSGNAAGNDGKSQTSKRKMADNAPKCLEELIVDAIPGHEPKHKLEVRLVRSSPRSPEFQETFQSEYTIYKKYQMIIHKDPPSKPTERQFTRFLVDSPLQPEHSDETPECGLGSFHQQYWLDGKLVAVGVLDILPVCVSSVYLFYDPDYDFLNLGTYSALRELAFTRLLHNVAPSIEYYYMGYYIHSCQKMKYKGNYFPSYIVCPEAFTWQPIENCRPKLDANKYSRLDDDTNATDPESLESIDRVLVLHQHAAMTYGQYRRIKPNANDEDTVKEYSGMVGKTCAERILLYRS